MRHFSSVIAVTTPSAGGAEAAVDSPTVHEQTPDPTMILGDSVTTNHRIDTVGGELSYTATAGRMTIGAEVFDDGKFKGNQARARVFVASYVLDAPDDERAKRPVTFIFNGGPGSPTVWLQFGLFGPHLVSTGDVDSRVTPPYALTENAHTLLIDSDLVFIDPMTTGFSRATADSDPSQYHGYIGDRDLIADAIRLWSTVNQRWVSPKFLAGESYGTTRAAALVGYLLRRHGMAFNGVILISSVLDFHTIDDADEGNDDPFVFYLPTFAGAAHYHGKHGDRDLRDLLDEVQAFAETDYRLALARGSRLPAAERREIGAKVAGYLGVSTEFVLRANLRVQHGHFVTELRRDDELTVGRLDTRFTQSPGRNNQAAMEVDPSLDFILQPYAFAANHYFRSVLGYETELTYELMYGRVFPWSYREFENRSVSSADDLAAAMRSNPDLKVYLASGFYDAATPYAAAEHVFAHLRIPAGAYDGIVSYYYEGGHMMYVNGAIRVAQSDHIREFVRWASGNAEKPIVAGEYRFHDIRTGLG